jgi:hypothetical protein
VQQAAVRRTVKRTYAPEALRGGWSRCCGSSCAFVTAPRWRRSFMRGWILRAVSVLIRNLPNGDTLFDAMQGHEEKPHRLRGLFGDNLSVDSQCRRAHESSPSHSACRRRARARVAAASPRTPETWQLARRVRMTPLYCVGRTQRYIDLGPGDRLSAAESDSRSAIET